MRAELADVKPAYAGWCKLYVATIRLPDGRTFTREIEDHGRATAMLPFDPVRRTAIVIRQLRAPALYVGRSDHLIEAVAAEIADAVLTAFDVHAVEVTIHKPSAPIPLTFADVSVTIRRSSRTESVPAAMSAAAVSRMQQ